MSSSSLNFSDMGYSFQADQRIWARTTPAAFSYSDGDGTENTLYRIIHAASDVSIFSKELRDACSDWPTRYHLSASRGNLLRPLAHRLKGNILEIGAGCGAITRFLGENGGEIVAIEGSSRRAMIAAERTRDLKNVTVVNDHFDRFDTTFRFDVITLIGVLEYSGVFGSGEDPVQSMLESARRLLKPDGVLLVAIENQLGLKYFAGALEDHLSVPMVGIQGLYSHPGVETFGRVELTRRFRQAGFQHVELALPFPDYKLPTSVVLPAANSESCSFDGSILAAQTASRDIQISSDQLTFSLECAWTIIGQNRLLPDLANSFLFAVSPASADDKPIFDAETFAIHYSSERQAAFCKLAKFTQGEEGVSVKHQRLCPNAFSLSSESVYRHVLPVELFSSGRTMSSDFIRVVLTPGWTVKQIAQFLFSYLQILFNEMGNPVASRSELDLSLKVPGHFLDTVPQNIILTESGHAIIDQEWSTNNDISLGYLTFRSFTTLIRMVSSFATPSDMRWLNQGQLFCEVFAHLGFDFTEALFEEYASQEAEFMTFVSGFVNTPIGYADWSVYKLPTFLDRSRSLTRPLVEFVEQLQTLSDTYLAQIKWLEGENDSRREQLEQMRGALAEVEQNNFQLTEEASKLVVEVSRLTLAASQLTGEGSQLCEEATKLTGEGPRLTEEVSRLSEEIVSIKESKTWKVVGRLNSIIKFFSKR
jgi:2-polyprenyl-3-methyl-5-hydroxy-6-metoxy-1,4-benzoquinol methylase